MKKSNRLRWAAVLAALTAVCFVYAASVSANCARLSTSWTEKKDCTTEHGVKATARGYTNPKRLAVWCPQCDNDSASGFGWGVRANGTTDPGCSVQGNDDGSTGWSSEQGWNDCATLLRFRVEVRD